MKHALSTAFILFSPVVFATENIEPTEAVVWSMNDYEAETGALWSTVNFSTIPGMFYELQSSSDLQIWETDRIVYGLGHELSLALFERQPPPPPEPGSTPPGPPEIPISVSFYLRPAAGGGILVSGHSLVDQQPYSALIGGTLAQEWENMPLYINNWNEPFDGHSFFLIATLHATEPPAAIPTLAPEDQAAVDALMAALPSINTEVSTNAALAASLPPPPPPAPGSRRFYRLARMVADSDGDQLLDHYELALGTDPFSTDTDGDGLDDLAELEFEQDPTTADSDGDGTPDGNEHYDPKWFGIRRTLDYLHQPDIDGTRSIITKGHWPAGPEEHQESVDLHPFPIIADTLESMLPWPNETPVPSEAAAFIASGYSESKPAEHPPTTPPGSGYLITPPSSTHTATLEHRRNILKLAKPAPEELNHQTILRIKRIVGEDEYPPQLVPVTVRIPAGSRQSEPIELEPFFIGGGINDEPYTEFVSVEQFNVYFEVPEQGAPPGTETGKWVQPDRLKVGRMKGGTAISAGFFTLSRDIDRFRVVIDGANADEASCKLSTKHADAEYSDPATSLEFEQEGGRWISKHQLLVSDTIDDAHHQVDDLLEIDTIAPDEQLGDRTHITALDGTVKIPSVTLDGATASSAHSRSVKSDGMLELIIVNIRQNGQLAVNPQQIERDLKAAKERYAQIGLHVTAGETIVRDVPAGVDMLDGIIDTNGLIQEKTIGGEVVGDYDLGVEQKLLLDSLNDLGNEKIVAVYVSELKPHPDEIAAAGAAGADAPQLAGTSFPQRYYHDTEEAAYRHIVMVGAGNWPFVMIHEVTHAAANLGHDGDSENLMNALVLQSDGSSFGDSKRIDKLQKSPILSSTFVQAGQ